MVGVRKRVSTVNTENKLAQTGVRRPGLQDTEALQLGSAFKVPSGKDHNLEAAGEGSPSPEGLQTPPLGRGLCGQLAAPHQDRGWGLHYHVITHRDKAGAEIICVHHAYLLLWGQWHQDTRRIRGGMKKGRPGARKTWHRGPEGRMRYMVSGSGRGKEHRSRCKYTTRENVHRKEGRQSREMQKSVHSMENGEERGRQARSRFPRKTTESRVTGRSSGRRSQVGTAEDEPHGPQEGGTGRSRQTEKRKRRNALFLAPDATPERAPCRRQVPGGRCQYHNPS